MSQDNLDHVIAVNFIEVKNASTWQKEKRHRGFKEMKGLLKNFKRLVIVSLSAILFERPNGLLDG